MRIAYKESESCGITYIDDIVAFSSDEELNRFVNNSDGNWNIIEKETNLSDGFEILKYVKITYQNGSPIEYEYKTTTSIESKWEDINRAMNILDKTIIMIQVESETECGDIANKVKELLDSMYFNTLIQIMDSKIINHDLSITNLSVNDILQKIVNKS